MPVEGGRTRRELVFVGGFSGCSMCALSTILVAFFFPWPPSLGVRGCVHERAPPKKCASGGVSPGALSTLPQQNAGQCRANNMVSRAKL